MEISQYNPNPAYPTSLFMFVQNYKQKDIHNTRLEIQFSVNIFSYSSL